MTENTENIEQESLIKFPEKFPIKAFGLSDSLFEQEIKCIINEFVDKKDILDFKINKSSKGKYSAITIMIMARDQCQLDSIYMKMTSSELVTMAL